MYHYDKNYIHAVPVYDASAATYYAAYTSGLAMYEAARPGRSLLPTYEIADNAMTLDFIASLLCRGIDCQLVPPHNPRSNNAERAIQTFKCHLIAALATCDPTNPISQIKVMTRVPGG